MTKIIKITESLGTGDNPVQLPLHTEGYSTRKFSKEELIAFYRANFPGTTLFEAFSRFEKEFYRLKESLLVSGENIERNLARLTIVDLGLSNLISEKDFSSAEVNRELGRIWNTGWEEK